MWYIATQHTATGIWMPRAILTSFFFQLVCFSTWFSLRFLTVSFQWTLTIQTVLFRPKGSYLHTFDSWETVVALWQVNENTDCILKDFWAGGGTVQFYGAVDSHGRLFLFTKPTIYKRGGFLWIKCYLAMLWSSSILDLKDLFHCQKCALSMEKNPSSFYPLKFEECQMDNFWTMQMYFKVLISAEVN